VITGPVDGKWRYDSFGKGGEGHRHGVYQFDSLEEVLVFADNAGYTHLIYWYSSPDKDRKAQDLADSWHSGKSNSYKRLKSWNRYRTCQTLVYYMALKASINRIDEKIHPKRAYELSKMFGDDFADLKTYLKRLRLRNRPHNRAQDEFMDGRGAEHGYNSFN
jgi:hypothetical protein